MATESSGASRLAHAATWTLVGPDPQLGEPWLLFIRNGGTEYYDRRIERRREEDDGA